MKCAKTAAILVFIMIGTLRAAQTPVPSSPKKDPSPEEIIRTFSAKESDFYDAWMQFTYRQNAVIQILSVDGQPSNERMAIVYDVVFRDDGTREVHVSQRSGRLRSLFWTEADSEVIINLQPFALTVKELPLYDLKYEGKEKVDELDCYVFSVKPKSTRGGRLYFQGRIWVDDLDLQIVRTVGKPVPQKDNKFPDFETVRQQVDGKYWFPVWTHAKSVLHFETMNVGFEETITYENYRKFGSKATIDYGPAKP